MGYIDMMGEVQCNYRNDGNSLESHKSSLMFPWKLSLRGSHFSAVRMIKQVSPSWLLGKSAEIMVLTCCLELVMWEQWMCILNLWNSCGLWNWACRMSMNDLFTAPLSGGFPMGMVCVCVSQILVDLSLDSHFLGEPLGKMPEIWEFTQRFQAFTQEKSKFAQLHPQSFCRFDSGRVRFATSSSKSIILTKCWG